MKYFHSLTHSLTHSPLTQIVATVILILMIAVSNPIYSQSLDHLTCEFVVDSTEFDNGSRVQRDSENGWYLPATGTIRILIIYAEINYSNSALDPDLAGTANWNVNNVPSWAGQLVDNSITTNPQGFLTRYYKQASSGNLNIIGDYLKAPTNNGVFTVNSSNSYVSTTELVNEVNSAMNGNFLTKSGIITPSSFDNWTNATSPGKPKITPSTDSPLSYDHVMVIWRNHGTLNGGNGFGHTGSIGSLIGYQSDTYTVFGSSSGKMPSLVARHEFAHFILGHNNFHSSGGGEQINYWIPHAGGYGLLSGAGSSLLSWNGWDRYRLGWENPSNTNLISARNNSGTEVNGNLDATVPSGAGIYILRDFVLTGDAIRIKLPFLDPNTEYEQWLWLENHRGFAINGNEFDQFVYESSTSCVEDIAHGLTAAIQIDKEQKIGDDLYDGYMEYVRQLSADGMWERSFDAPTLDQCLPPSWNNYPRPATKIRENTLTGRSDLDRAPINFNNDNKLVHSEQVMVSADKVNGTYEYKLFGNGNPRQLFTLSGNNEISIGTNPPSSARMNQVGLNVANSNAKNVRSIYLNGVKIEILDMLSNGDIKIRIDFDHVEIENDVVWMAPDIVLNEIPTQSGYSLNVQGGNTLTLDHGAAATRMVGTESFEGNDVFTSPTIMRVKENAVVNLETGSELIIDRKSTLKLEENSRLNVQDGAILRIKRDGLLDIQTDALVSVMDGGRIIIENSSGNYGPGMLHFEKGARINLNGSHALIDVNGIISIGDDAIFRLSDQTSLTRTSGKIKFQGGGNNDVEIIAAHNASVNLQGYSKNQEVIINLKSVLEFPDNLVECRFINLRISQGYADRISPPYSNTCAIEFQNTLITNINGGNGNHGIKLYGQANLKINDCTFQGCKYGIQSYSFELNNSLSVKDSEFNDCYLGIFTSGKGANLTNVDFDDCDYAWEASNTSAASNIKNCTANNIAYTTIDYSGATTLYVTYSQFHDAQRGISASQATLKAKCNELSNHDLYAVYGTQNASLIMAPPYGSNKLAGNDRTIELYKANSIDLNLGVNDLRPNTTGTQDIIHGSLICSGSSTISADKNKWHSNGSGPTSNDYDVFRDCPQPVQVNFTDANPLNLLPEGCTQIGPGGLSGRPVGNTGINTGISTGKNESTLNEEQVVEWNSLIQSLRSGSIFDYVNCSSPDCASELIPVNEYIDLKVDSYTMLSDLILESNSIETVGNTLFINSLTELFSTFIELNSVPDSIAIISGEELENLYTTTLATLDNASEYLNDDSDMLFGLHLSKAQTYRVNGSYSLALSEIDLAQNFATEESQIDLAERLNCLYNAESIMVANPEKDEWPEAYGACEYVSNAEAYAPENISQIETKNAVKIQANPNPTNSIVQIQSIDTELTFEIIELFDSYGRMINSAHTNNIQILNMSKLPNGIYFVRVKFIDGSFATTKVLKSE